MQNRLCKYRKTDAKLRKKQINDKKYKDLLDFTCIERRKTYICHIFMPEETPR